MLVVLVVIIVCLIMDGLESKKKKKEKKVKKKKTKEQRAAQPRLLWTLLFEPTDWHQVLRISLFKHYWLAISRNKAEAIVFIHPVQSSFPTLFSFLIPQLVPIWKLQYNES